MLPSQPSPPGTRRSPRAKVLFLLCLAAAVFFLPYLFPVAPSISLSYIAGFSNRAAIVLFVLGIVLFAVFTRGDLAPIADEADRPLSTNILFISLLITFIVCATLAWHSAYRRIGQEADYAINRQLMLAAGFHPYTQFEFLYGPLLIYPGYLIALGLHLAQPAGYYISWVFEWLLGTWFLWTILRGLDIPLRYRLSVYAAIFLLNIPSATLVGLNYTPFRAFAASFLVCVIYFVWKRTANPWLMAVVATLATALAMLISMEQAVGVIVGASAYMVLLALSSRVRFPWTAAALYLAGCALCIFLALRAHLLVNVVSYASGGLKFPLLPSVATCLLLFVYVAAAALCWRHIRSGRLDSAAVPLVIAGIAMLPSALGRPDLGHIRSASPAFITGIAAISTMPAIRRWWTVLTCLALGLPIFLGLGGALAHRLARTHPSSARTSPAPAIANAPSLPASFPARLAANRPPCDQVYFAPSYVPWQFHFDPKCVETGYYLGPWNMSTPADMDHKIEELAHRPSQPLLLSSDDLEDQFITDPADMDMQLLYSLEQAYYVPHPRHANLTFAPVIDYIRAHYTEGPVVNDGELQIWYPRGFAAPASSPPRP